MSSISDVYNGIVTRIETVLPNHRRLPNPYRIEDNNSLYLEQGYGIALGEGVNANLTTCKMETNRNFQLIVTRRFYATEHDAARKALTELAVLEDLFLIMNDLQQNGTFTFRDFIQFEGDSGILPLFSETDSFLYVTSDFSITYSDDFV